MLGIFFIYFIGKSFYTLSEQYLKNKWLFAILGVVSYYGGLMLGGFIFGLAYALWANETIDTLSNYIVALISLPFGILACYIFYIMLKKVWRKEWLERDINILGEDVIKEI